MGKGDLIPALGKHLCRLCVGLTIMLLVLTAHAGSESVESPLKGDVESAGGTGAPGEESKKLADSAVGPAQNDGKKTGENQQAEKKEHGSDEVFQLGEVTVTGKIMDEATVNMPAVVETLTAEGIERINTVETSDVFKYMPGSYLRKLYPGLTNQPLVIRGNNTELTGRTLVLMDGILISDFTAAGNSNGPKWFLVAPQEIERVDMIYGPFSAALSGNSLSGTAMITTHFPEELEVEADAKYFYQNFREYKTDEDIHGYTSYASFGDKLGKFSFDVWYNRLETDIQPISYMTRLESEGKPPVGKPVSGWVKDTDPSGKSRFILGSTGVSDLVNNTFKVKLAYDLTPDSQLRLISALWDSKQDYDSPETFLRDAGGNPLYSGTVDIGGVSYKLASSTFTYSSREMQDLLNAVTYSLDSPGGWKVTASASSYNKLDDLNRVSATAAPESKSGGAGTVTDSDGGWYTADLKAAHDVSRLGVHTLAMGYHFDRYSTESRIWNASDWLKDTRTSLSLGSEGKTLTNAMFVEDTWKIEEQWSVYLGGRYEWWSGFDGAKSTDTTSGRVTSTLDDEHEDNFSPKFSTTYSPNENWRLRLSLALATRYPTVGELFFGGINTQGIINNANPDLKPEQSFAKDFTITRTIGHDGEARLTLFEDDVENAIFTQTSSYTLVRNYQNVDEVRTRGIEFAVNKRRFLIDGLGAFANVAWTDSEILRNDDVPTSVGKTFPRVPEWRAKCILDYSPSELWALTFAGHYGSRQFGNLDNSDTKGGYGGIDDFLVLDVKFSYRFLKSLSASVGVDNLTDELYHVSHPYPRRTYFVELKYYF